MKTHKIICYIPVEPEDPLIFTSQKEAEQEKEHLEFLQPENIYQIEDDDDPE
jgi:hypothetical protein